MGGKEGGRYINGGTSSRSALLVVSGARRSMVCNGVSFGSSTRLSLEAGESLSRIIVGIEEESREGRPSAEDAIRR